MKNDLEERILQYLENTNSDDISDEMFRLIMTFERATKSQIERLEKLLKEAGYGN